MTFVFFFIHYIQIYLMEWLGAAADCTVTLTAGCTVVSLRAERQYEKAGRLLTGTVWSCLYDEPSNMKCIMSLIFCTFNLINQRSKTTFCDFTLFFIKISLNKGLFFN